MLKRLLLPIRAWDELSFRSVPKLEIGKPLFAPLKSADKTGAIPDALLPMPCESAKGAVGCVADDAARLSEPTPLEPGSAAWRKRGDTELDARRCGASVASCKTTGLSPTPRGGAGRACAAASESKDSVTGWSASDLYLSCTLLQIFEWPCSSQNPPLALASSSRGCRPRCKAAPTSNTRGTVLRLAADLCRAHSAPDVTSRRQRASLFRSILHSAPFFACRRRKLLEREISREAAVHSCRDALAPTRLLFFSDAPSLSSKADSLEVCRLRSAVAGAMVGASRTRGRASRP